jgi:hypothetical protein
LLQRIELRLQRRIISFRVTLTAHTRQRKESATRFPKKKLCSVLICRNRHWLALLQLNRDADHLKLSERYPTLKVAPMLLIAEKRQSKREAIDRISQVYLADVPRPLSESSLHHA